MAPVKTFQNTTNNASEASDLSETPTTQRIKSATKCRKTSFLPSSYPVPVNYKGGQHTHTHMQGLAKQEKTETRPHPCSSQRNVNPSVGYTGYVMGNLIYTRASARDALIDLTTMHTD